MAAKKGGLGRGFSAIMLDNTLDESNTAVPIKISEIEPNRSQPRKEFNEQALNELCDSIRKHGIIQPLLLRSIADGGYQIVAGERRWRAARMAGLTEVPAVVRELTDQEVMTLALIENLQREDLSPLEEAEGYFALMDAYEMTQEEIAQLMGKSRPAVANALRLLNLPPSIRGMLAEGKLTAGHARALLGVKDEKKQLEIAKIAVDGEISVRQIEKLVAAANKEDESIPQKQKKEPGRCVFYGEVELALRQHMGRKVTVKGTDSKGILEIEFYNPQDLADITKLMIGEET